MIRKKGKYFNRTLHKLRLLAMPTHPISKVFGIDRGLPIDRYYIEKFLSANSKYIRGDVMEVSESTYTKMFGGKKVNSIDVLNFKAADQVTIVADLATGDGIPSNAYDCVIITQTFHVIEDISSAITNAGKSVKSGGVILSTLPGITQISRYDMDRWGDYWRFTILSVQSIFEKALYNFNIKVVAYGNVKSTVAFLYGYAAQDLSLAQLDQYDDDYQMIIGVIATKK